MILPNYAGLIVNIFLLATLLILIYSGYRKGFITQIVGFFSIILAGLIAWTLYKPFGSLFIIIPERLVPFQTTNLKGFFLLKSNSLLWYIIIFLTALIIIKFITKVLDLISKAPFINTLNRLLGVIFSMINFAFIVWILIFALSLPLFTNGNDVIDNSLLKYNHDIIELIDPLLEKPLEQLSSTQQVIKKPEQATTEDIENMQKWLIKNKISIEDVLTFFKEIKDE